MPGQTIGELGIKLTVDTNAKEALDKIKKAMGDVDKKTDDTKKKIDATFGGNASKLGSLMKGALGITAGAALAAGAAVVGFGYESAHAFMESAKQVKTIANNFALLDTSGASLEKIKSFAASTKDELEELGIQAGVADDELVSVFNNIIERGGKTVEQAHELTGSMALAGRAAEGGAQGLSEAFEAIQMGVIRAKNPIVGMIAATHTLKGNAKEVAKQMSKMSTEEQMKLAETAIGKMADKMKNAPLTMGQSITSMKVAFENIFETAGEPMIKHLTPAVRKVRELFLKIQPDLQEAGEEFGNVVGKAIDTLLPIMDALFGAIHDNMGDVKKGMDELYAPMKDLFTYMYENKEAFAKTFADIAIVLMKAMQVVMKVTKAIVGAVIEIAKFAGKHGPIDWATGSGKAIAQGEMDNEASAARKKTNSVFGMSGEEKKEAARRYAESYADAMGGDYGEAFAKGILEFDKVIARATEDHANTMNTIKQNEAARYGDTASFVKAWQAATKTEDEAARHYAANFLQNNQMLVKALAEDGPKLLGEGFGKLLDTLKEQNQKEIIDQLKKGPQLGLGLSAKNTITQNFSGPINVKQDFRDQDPDAIMVMMKKEFGRAGINRTQSRLGSIYGF